MICVYAFWRRAVAPTFLFDSAQRRYCEVRSQRTNTPLQALTLLNDVSMLEASRALARDVITKKPDSTSRLELIFRSVLSRSPTATEANVLSRELGQALKHYQQAPGDAIAFLDFGQPENRSAEKPEELAAYMVVASMVFNLDEAMTHE